MKRGLVLGAALALLVVAAPPALAETNRVNAAENLTRYDSNGNGCAVLVDDFDEMTVNPFCFGEGSAWFKVRVPGVHGRVTGVATRATGDCSGRGVTFTKNRLIVVVRVGHTGGDFDCTYSTIIVRSSG